MEGVRLLVSSTLVVTFLIHVTQAQNAPPPHFVNPYEEENNKTIDQLISDSVGGVDVAANMMLAPGSKILAEMDMYMSTEQFLSLYEPPKADDMIKLGLMAPPVGTSYDAERKNFFDAVEVARKERHRKKRKATRNASTRWPQATMPYLFAKGHFEPKEEYMMRRAMTEWERYTCLKFKPATETDRNYVRFQNGAGCNSQLGMVGGVQVLNLQAPGCRYKGLYLHEIGHALGLVHEHQLPDRDDYITILYHNVSPHMRIWFNKYSTEQVDQMNVPYQLSSVMHYGITAFSKDGKAQTIRARDHDKEHTIGRVYLKELAYTDVMIVNKMYECASHCPDQNKCGRDGHLDQNCNCICRDGSQDCDATKRSSSNGNCRNNYDSWSCYIWANQGECERNPTYMNQHCAKACGSCGNKGGNSDLLFLTWSWQWFPMFANMMPKDWTQLGVCKDVYEPGRCQVWKERGDCVTNSRWMEEHCQATCNFCTGRNAITPQTNCDNRHQEAGKCAEWSLVGECTVNRRWMGEQCAKSCRVCDGGDNGGGGNGGGDGGGDGGVDEDKLECVDTHENCDLWARNNECSANPSWMINNCRKACGKCDDKTCKNLYDDVQCQIWEQKLRCLHDSEWMTRHCAKACLSGPCKDLKPEVTTTTTRRPSGSTRRTTAPTVTQSTCRNRHSSDKECEVWAENGHCNINPNWMGKYCTKSCRLCAGGDDKTTTTTTTTTDGRTNICRDAKEGCSAWAKHGFCDTNPRYNLIFCKKSCNNCNGCRDTEYMCSVWAKAGHCINNARYMLRYCQKSCNACLMERELEVLQPVEPVEEVDGDGGAGQGNGGDVISGGGDGGSSGSVAPMMSPVLCLFLACVSVVLMRSRLLKF